MTNLPYKLTNPLFALLRRKRICFTSLTILDHTGKTTRVVKYFQHCKVMTVGTKSISCTSQCEHILYFTVQTMRTLTLSPPTNLYTLKGSLCQIDYNGMELTIGNQKSISRTLKSTCKATHCFNDTITIAKYYIKLRAHQQAILDTCLIIQL